MFFPSSFQIQCRKEISCRDKKNQAYSRAIRGPKKELLTHKSSYYIYSNYFLTEFAHVVTVTY